MSTKRNEPILRMPIISSIKNKLLLLQIITAVFSVMLCGLLLTASYYNMFGQSEQQSLEVVAKVMSSNVQIPFSFGDSYANEVENTLKAFRSDTTVLSACLFDEKAKVFAAFHKDTANYFLPTSLPNSSQALYTYSTHDTLHTFYRFEVDGNIGYFYVQKKSSKDKVLLNLITATLVVILISVLLGVLSALFLQKTISTPIASLIDTMQNVAKQQDYSMRVAESGEAELQTMSQVFNEMLLQVEKRDDSLQEIRYQLEERVEQRTKELQDKTQALQLSNNELQQFAYIASHDMQEPLRIIGSFSQILTRRYQDTLDSEMKEYLAFIVDAVGRMQALIKDLLSFSRVGTMKMTVKPIMLSNLLLKCTSNLRLAIEENKAQINYANYLPVINADETKTLQLFQNLLSNAIKFKKDNIPPIINIEVQEEPSEWIFSISDNGIGINNEYSEKIFMIFQRLSTAYSGTGIGLAICKKVVELHGGRIWFESEKDKGTIFYFTYKKDI